MNELGYVIFCLQNSKLFGCRILHFVMDNIEENSESEMVVTSGDEFFLCLETHLNASIPEYVKNILKINGFCTAFMMSKLTEAKIKEIEAFMRDDFADFMIQTPDTMDKYLGVYKNCQKKFKFLSGHKILLEIMRDACQEYYPLNSSSSKAVSKSKFENIDDSSKTEIFQKLYDGVTNWLNNQGNFKQVNITTTHLFLCLEYSFVGSSNRT